MTRGSEKSMPILYAPMSDLGDVAAEVRPSSPNAGSSTMSAEEIDTKAAQKAESPRDGEWSVPEPPAATMARHVLTSRQRAVLNRRLASLPGDIAAGRTRSMAEVLGTIEHMRVEQGG